jgi:hypothetical protein
MPVLMPQDAGRTLSEQDRGPQLRDECAILAFYPLAAFRGL